MKKPHSRQSNVYTEKAETRVNMFTLIFAQFLAHSKHKYLLMSFILYKPSDS